MNENPYARERCQQGWRTGRRLALPLLALVISLPYLANAFDLFPHAVAQSKTIKKDSANKRRPSSANRFNRLFRGHANFNLPPAKDGIHDPIIAGTLALQAPKEAFAELPKSRSGNRVDWVKALEMGIIEPRADRLDAEEKMQEFDMNIVREVKGSMPDVVYPHKQHTQWLDCRNCHPKIFIPKKGGNNISMAAILMGQYCGVCHGKVAFPVSECRRCHSKPKSPKQLAEIRKQRSARRLSTAELLAAPMPASKKPTVLKAALKAVQKKNEPPKSRMRQMSMKELMAKGKEVYDENCSACHGEKGQGIPKAFPPIAGSKIVLGPVSEHVRIVLNGKTDTAMQAWKDELNWAEIAAVITFQRNAFGNKKGDMVRTAQIRRLSR